jgi:putative oxidoreductase
VTTQSEDYGRHNLFSDSGYYEAADDETTLTEPEDRLAEYEDTPAAWHGGLDLGLLILRLALGGTLGVHGVQKVFGLFGGPGIAEFSRILGDQGYVNHTELLSWITGIAEIAGGVLLILGLFTPIAAGALLGITGYAVYLKYSDGYFLGTGEGYEYHVMLAAVALALLFTGPGRVALDVNTPWRRRPVPFGIVGFVLAAGAAAAVYFVFR